MYRFHVSNYRVCRNVAMAIFRYIKMRGLGIGRFRYDCGDALRGEREPGDVGLGLGAETTLAATWASVSLTLP